MVAKLSVALQGKINDEEFRLNVLGHQGQGLISFVAGLDD